MTAIAAHKDIRSIRETLNRAPGVAGKMVKEANAYRGQVIAIWFRNARTRKSVINTLAALNQKVFMPKPGKQTFTPAANAKIAVLTSHSNKQILNKTLSRFCSDVAALPVFLLDESPSMAALADLIWIVREDGNVEEVKG